jgi:hypothetical protein
MGCTQVRALAVCLTSRVGSTVSCLPRKSRARPNTRNFTQQPDSSASPLGQGGGAGGRQMQDHSQVLIALARPPSHDFLL